MTSAIHLQSHAWNKKMAVISLAALLMVGSQAPFISYLNMPLKVNVIEIVKVALLQPSGPQWIKKLKDLVSVSQGSNAKCEKPALGQPRCSS